MLLRPSPKLNELVIGIIAKAQEQFDMTIFCVVVLSNHLHMLLDPKDANHMAQFMGFVLGNISKEVGNLHDWPGSMFDGPYKSQPILDDESFEARMRYLLAHGVKEGLVLCPTHWPGVHSAGPLGHGEPLKGRWYDRSTEYEVKRSGKAYHEHDYSEEKRVVLSPPPVWGDLNEQQLRTKIRHMLRDIRAQYDHQREVTGQAVLGVARVMSADPHERPEVLKKSPSPWCHAVSVASRRTFRRFYRECVQAYRDAVELWKAGVEECRFPVGMCLPYGMRRAEAGFPT